MLILSLIQGCVGTDVIDDLVEVRLEISNPIMSLKIGDSYTLMHRYLNNVGMEESAEVRWISSNEASITIDENGLVMALQAGESEITVVLSENDQVMDKILVEASGETVVVSSGKKSGTIATTSSYVLSGDFEIINTDNGVQISIANNYTASTALPGLYVYLSNNPSTVSGALEIQAVTVFSGAHTYNVEAEGLNVDTYTYLLYFCKPFNVKVGHGEIQD